MPRPAKSVFRQRFCRACRALFYVCSYCDRGQVYCSQTCRQPARCHQRRQANHRHQQTLRGRLAHSRRQHAYRLRRARHHCQRVLNAALANKVTDHSSQALLRVRPSHRVNSATGLNTIWSLLRALWTKSDFVVCQFCDRSGQFVSTPE